MTRINRGAALIAALLVTPALVAAATNVAVGADGGRSDDNDQGGGSLPLIQRAADGPVDVQGGAAREDGDQTQLIRDSLRTGKVKNVILLIGDGMGDREITIARNYQVGADGRFAGMDTLPLTGQYTTYAVEGRPASPTTCTDSAASGTGWSTGTRPTTARSRCDRHGTRVPDHPRAGQGRRLQDRRRHHRGDPGRDPGRRWSRTSPTAPATARTSRSATCPDATPRRTAAPARSPSSCSTPAPTSCSAAARRRSTRPSRPAPWTGTDRASSRPIDRGYQVVTDAAGLAGVTAADQAKPILGLFAPGNLDPVESARRRHRRRRQRRRPSPASPTRPSPRRQPHLSDMTDKAIDAARQQVRAQARASSCRSRARRIDKQDHAANPCGQIGETVEFDEAVQAALDFAKQHRNTLVVVTADHGHTSQIVDGRHRRRPALTATLLTADGAADDDQLRHRAGSPGRSSTPAPRCGSPPTARRPPTCSASPTRPTSSSP